MEFKVYTTERANPDAVDPMTIEHIGFEKDPIKSKPGEPIIPRRIYILPDGTQINQEEYDRIWEEWSKTKIVPRDGISLHPR